MRRGRNSNSGLSHSKSIMHSPSAVRCVYSDASDAGYGGYTVEHGMHIAQGIWSSEEAQQSSTWSELVAVGRILESAASRLCNTHGSYCFHYTGIISPDFP